MEIAFWHPVTATTPAKILCLGPQVVALRWDSTKPTAMVCIVVSDLSLATPVGDLNIDNIVFLP